MKRLLFEVHRWVGVVLATFMLLWFLSGLVIVFTGQLTQSRGNQLAHAEALLPESTWLSLGEAWRLSKDERKLSAEKERNGRSRAGREEGARPAGRVETRQKNGNGQSAAIAEAKLITRGGVPLWLVDDAKNRRIAISAVDGKLVKFSERQALKVAAEWLTHEGLGAVTTQYLGLVESTSSLRNQQQLKPFHRVAVNDGAGTELLISSKSGEVLQAATRFDRGLYYVGNWLHLFRPLDAIGLGEYRHATLTWLGFFAFAGALTGMIVGWLRWRPGWFGKPTYSEGRKQPYRKFWFKWHFWAGLIGGTFALLWAFSGYLDNNPFKLFSEGDISKEEMSRYLGDDVSKAMQDWKPQLISATASTPIVEYSWKRLGNQAVLLATTRSGQRLPQTIAGAVRGFDEHALNAAAKRLVKDVPVIKQALIHEYDSYYYLRHHRDVTTRPLPVIRLELGDAVATHLYIDPQDGKLVLRRDNSSRALRWLYSGLHHWDFGGLYKRPFWDGWMVTWILFGLVLSLSSVIIGWQRLVVTLRPAKKKASKTAVKPTAQMVTPPAGDMSTAL